MWLTQIVFELTNMETRRHSPVHLMRPRGTDQIEVVYDCPKHGHIRVSVDIQDSAGHLALAAEMYERLTGLPGRPSEFGAIKTLFEMLSD